MAVECGASPYRTMEIRKMVPVILYVLQFAACFTVNPVNQTVPINSTAYFSCALENGYPDDIAWSVYLPDLKKNYVDVEESQGAVLAQRGFQFGYDDMFKYMNVSATELNNGSHFRCREFNIVHGSAFSESAYLTVVGPPLPPGVKMSLLSATEILLEWEEPFTIQGYPVHNYTVVETEVATGRSMRSTNHTLNHTRSTSYIATQCIDIEFTVMATNEIGSSIPATIVTGFPVAPGNFSNIQVVVRFKSNRDPEVTVSISPPPVCDFQLAKLTLEVTKMDSYGSVFDISHNFSGAPEPLIIVIENKLMPNTNYSLVATVTSAAGNATTEVLFDTVLVPQTNASLLGGLIGGVVGGAFLLFLVVVLCAICFCMVLNYRAAKALRSSGGVGDMQDCTYESIDDFQIVHASTRKNQYQNSYPAHIPRPESPYQPMKAANPSSNGYPTLDDPMASPHYITTPYPMMSLQTSSPDADLPVNQKDKLKPTTNGSAPEVPEDAYIAMNRVDTPSNQQRLSTVSAGNQSNGDYRLSIC